MMDQLEGNGFMAAHTSLGHVHSSSGQMNLMKFVNYNSSCLKKDTEIAELELENSLLQEKVKELKQTNLKNRDQLEEILLENSVTREGMYTTTADKKLYVFLLIYWVFFFCCLHVQKVGSCGGGMVVFGV
ncbi:RUN domain-containing protein 3A [Bienertia sinuspersici]